MKDRRVNKSYHGELAIDRNEYQGYPGTNQTAGAGMTYYKGGDIDVEDLKKRPAWDREYVEALVQEATQSIGNTVEPNRPEQPWTPYDMEDKMTKLAEQYTKVQTQLKAQQAGNTVEPNEKSWRHPVVYAELTEFERIARDLRWSIYVLIERYEGDYGKTISGCLKREVEELFREHNLL
jgi:hypothetical protein